MMYMLLMADNFYESFKTLTRYAFRIKTFSLHLIVMDHRIIFREKKWGKNLKYCFELHTTKRHE